MSSVSLIFSVFSLPNLLPVGADISSAASCHSVFKKGNDRLSVFVNMDQIGVTVETPKVIKSFVLLSALSCEMCTL